MRTHLFILLSTITLFTAGCTGGGSSSGTDTDTETGSGTASTSTSGTSTSTTSTTMTSTTTAGGGYWGDGTCLGPDSPSDDDCMSVDAMGECTNDGKVIYCQDGALYCIDCEGDGAMCGLNQQFNYYDCIQGGGTSTGTSTGTGTGTSTSTGG